MAKKDKKEKKKDKKKVSLKTVESKKPSKVTVKKKVIKPAIPKKVIKPPKVDTKKGERNNKTRLSNALKEIDAVINKVKDPVLVVVSNAIGTDGKIKFEMKWNDLFIKNVNKHGISGATEEETAMLFLVGCQLKPEEFPAHDEEVVSESHPLLTAESNLLKQ